MACPTDVADKTILGLTRRKARFFAFIKAAKHLISPQIGSSIPKSNYGTQSIRNIAVPILHRKNPVSKTTPTLFDKRCPISKNWLFKSGVKVLPIFSILRKIFWTVSENIRIKNTDCNCRRYRMKNFKSSRLPVWPMYSSEWDRGTMTRSAQHKTWDWIKNIKPFPTGC